MNYARPIWLFTILMFASIPLAACGQPAPDGQATIEQSADKTALMETIEAYDNAYAAKDFNTIIDLSLPDKILAILTTEGGPTDEAGVAAMRQEMVSAFETQLANLSGFSYDVITDEMTIEQTPQGLKYSILPTTALMKLPTYSIKSEGTTLAVHDEGKWYLLNPQDAESISWFKDAYPSLKNLDIQPNKMEVLQ